MFRVLSRILSLGGNIEIVVVGMGPAGIAHKLWGHAPSPLLRKRLRLSEMVSWSW